jgi:hypothetical protein
MKKIFVIIFSAFILFSCKDKIVQPENTALFNYSGYDSSNTLISEGWLKINFEDSTKITGEWHIKKLNNSQNTGLGDESGSLIGGTNNKSVWLNLNPDYVDNNLFLVGVLSKNKFEGNWQWITFAGITNSGNFIAIKSED